MFILGLNISALLHLLIYRCLLICWCLHLLCSFTCSNITGAHYWFCIKLWIWLSSMHLFPCNLCTHFTVMHTCRQNIQKVVMIDLILFLIFPLYYILTNAVLLHMWCSVCVCHSFVLPCVLFAGFDLLGPLIFFAGE